jgi:hypothetical protein
VEWIDRCCFGDLCWTLPVRIYYFSCRRSLFFLERLDRGLLSCAYSLTSLIDYIHSWFFTYNYLSEAIPKRETQLGELGRRAILGFCSSAVSDTCSNSIRVLKVYKQSHPEQLSYPEVLRRVLAESGVSGLFFRGLETKILANGLQGILFSILWKQFEELFFKNKK